MSKILNGNAASIRDFPHHVSVQYLEHHICGGSVISGNHVLLAANCVVLDLNTVTGNLRVLAGTHNRIDEAAIPGTYHYVKYIIYHPEYSPKLFWKNDIAILTVCFIINQLFFVLIFSNNAYIFFLYLSTFNSFKHQ